eukprot:1783301-Prymnesium_polylepis.2
METAASRALPKSFAEDLADSVTWLEVPFAEKDMCKRMGGRWDADRRQWFVPAGVDRTHMRQWMKTRIHLTTCSVFHEKDLVKSRGVRWDAGEGKWYICDDMDPGAVRSMARELKRPSIVFIARGGNDVPPGPPWRASLIDDAKRSLCEEGRCVHFVRSIRTLGDSWDRVSLNGLFKNINRIDGRHGGWLKGRFRIETTPLATSAEVFDSVRKEYANAAIVGHALRGKRKSRTASHCPARAC